MAAERIVIVGAGPAGLATARSYRECGGDGVVTLVGRERHLPYQRPPLTKELLRGELARHELSIEPEQWFSDNGVELCLGAQARRIEPQNGTVALADGRELSATAIVLATGSEPTRPDLPGMADRRVLTMRALEDSEALAQRAQGDMRAIVVGTGFIGCEIAGSLALGGVPVTLIGQEPLPQLPRLGAAAAERIAGWLTELGVEHVGDASVAAVHDAREVELSDGRRIRGDCVVLGAGVRPRSELARAAEVPTRDGAVLVDASMRSLAGAGTVLAVGDVALAHNSRAGRELRVEHWGDALEHGAVAGRTLARGDGRWDAVPGFWSTIAERTLKHAAWGDGHEECRFEEHPEGAFTVWYTRRGATVGVLAHERDQDYERGRGLIARGAPPP